MQLIGEDTLNNMIIPLRCAFFASQSQVLNTCQDQENKLKIDNKAFDLLSQLI